MICLDDKENLVKQFLVVFSGTVPTHYNAPQCNTPFNTTLQVSIHQITRTADLYYNSLMLVNASQMGKS